MLETTEDVEKPRSHTCGGLHVGEAKSLDPITKVRRESDLNEA